MNNNCCAALPYPKIAVKAPNARYAQILSNLYAGPDSELTGISNYIYQSIVFSDYDRGASDLFECIALSEMKHFDTLGMLIYKLGEAPKFRVKNGRKSDWWSGSDVLYEKDFEAVVRADIADEKAGIEAYRDAIRRIDDSLIVDNIERIIADEEHHIEILTGLLYPSTGHCKYRHS